MSHTSPALRRPAGRAPVLAIVEHVVVCVLTGLVVTALVKAVAPTSPESTSIIAFTVSILLTSVLLRAAVRWWYGPTPGSRDDQG